MLPTAITAAAYIRRASAFPQLAQLDSALGRHFLVASEARLVPTADGSLRVQPDRGRWPGLSLEDVRPDWRAYSTLVIDLSNTEPRALRIFVRIDDRRPDPAFADRYNQEFDLLPASRRIIRIALTEVESAPTSSKIDLARIARIMLFEDGSEPTGTFYLNSLRLER